MLSHIPEHCSATGFLQGLGQEKAIVCMWQGLRYIYHKSGFFQTEELGFPFLLNSERSIILWVVNSNDGFGSKLPIQPIQILAAGGLKIPWLRHGGTPIFWQEQTALLLAAVPLKTKGFISLIWHHKLTLLLDIFAISPSTSFNVFQRLCWPGFQHLRNW